MLVGQAFIVVQSGREPIGLSVLKEVGQVLAPHTQFETRRAAISRIPQRLFARRSAGYHRFREYESARDAEPAGHARTGQRR